LILGIGSDLIDITRIEAALDRFGPRFINRVFTPVEQDKSERRANRAASYARRFAAKEACAKALGTGMNKGVFWRDMGVMNRPGGQPTLGMTARIDLSMTDDPPLAQAIVIISAIPADATKA
jgi:holo-[acyl-carrier protein] synthase